MSPPLTAAAAGGATSFGFPLGLGDVGGRIRVEAVTRVQHAVRAPSQAKAALGGAAGDAVDDAAAAAADRAEAAAETAADATSPVEGREDGPAEDLEGMSETPTVGLPPSIEAKAATYLREAVAGELQLCLYRLEAAAAAPLTCTGGVQAAVALAADAPESVPACSGFCPSAVCALPPPAAAATAAIAGAGPGAAGVPRRVAGRLRLRADPSVAAPAAADASAAALSAPFAVFTPSEAGEESGTAPVSFEAAAVVALRVIKHSPRCLAPASQCCGLLVTVATPAGSTHTQTGDAAAEATIAIADDSSTDSPVDSQGADGGNTAESSSAPSSWQLSHYVLAIPLPGHYATAGPSAAGPSPIAATGTVRNNLALVVALRRALGWPVHCATPLGLGPTRSPSGGTGSASANEMLHEHAVFHFPPLPAAPTAATATPEPGAATKADIAVLGPSLSHRRADSDQEPSAVTTIVSADASASAPDTDMAAASVDDAVAVVSSSENAEAASDDITASPIDTAVAEGSALESAAAPAAPTVATPAAVDPPVSLNPFDHFPDEPLSPASSVTATEAAVEAGKADADPSAAAAGRSLSTDQAAPAPVPSAAPSSGLSSVIARLEKDVASKEQQLRQLRDKERTEREGRTAAETALKKRESELESLRQTLKSTTTDAQKVPMLQRELQTLATTLGRIRTERDELKALIKDREERDTQAVELEAMKTALAHAATNAETAETALAALQTEFQMQQVQLLDRDAVISALVEEQQQLRARRDEWARTEQERQELRERLQQQTGLLDSLRDMTRERYDALTAELAAAQVAVSTERTRAQEAEARILALQLQLDTLTEHTASAALASPVAGEGKTVADPSSAPAKPVGGDTTGSRRPTPSTTPRVALSPSSEVSGGVFMPPSLSLAPVDIEAAAEIARLRAALETATMERNAAQRKVSSLQKDASHMEALTVQKQTMEARAGELSVENTRMAALIDDLQSRLVMQEQRMMGLAATPMLPPPASPGVTGQRTHPAAAGAVHSSSPQGSQPQIAFPQQPRTPQPVQMLPHQPPFAGAQTNTGGNNNNGPSAQNQQQLVHLAKSLAEQLADKEEFLHMQRAQKEMLATRIRHLEEQIRRAGMEPAYS